MTKIGIFSQGSGGGPNLPPGTIDPDAPCTGDPLPGYEGDFLSRPANHTYDDGVNTALVMESLPSGGVFPHGQRMFMAGYEMSTSLMSRAKAAGFTVAGAYGNNYASVKGKLATAASNGFQYMALLRRIGSYLGSPNGACPSGCACNDDRATFDQKYDCYSDSGERIFQNAKYEMDLYENDPNGDKVYGWLYCLDDYRTRQAASKQNVVYEKIADYEKTLRPSSPRTLGDFGLGDSYASGNYQALTQFMTDLVKQQYFGGGDFTSDGEGTKKSRFVHGLTSWQAKRSGERATYEGVAGKTTNGLPRVIPPGDLFGYAWNVVPELNRNDSYIRRQIMHDFLVTLMMGSNGYWIYQLKEGYGGFSTKYGYARMGAWRDESGEYENEIDRWFSLLFEQLTILTSNRVDMALLWGDRTPAEPVGYTHIDGGRQAQDRNNPVAGTDGYYRVRVSYQTHINTNSGGNAVPESVLPIAPTGDPAVYTVFEKYDNGDWLDAYMVTMRDIQYKGIRYITLTNSMPMKETVTWWNNNPDGVSKGQINPNTGENSTAQASHPETGQPWSDANGAVKKNQRYFIYQGTTLRTGHCWEKESPSNAGTLEVPPSVDGVQGGMKFRLDSLPTSNVKAIELITGTDITSLINGSGEMTINLQPMESMIIAITAADGYCAE